jgi:CelD/BcsL family acetyltransferase involved in cellulose biosynthesis
MRASVLTSPDAVGALSAEWAQLWRRCPSATPFQHPAWMLPWIRHMRGDAALRCIAMWSGERLCAVIPLVHLVRNGRRVLLLAGAGTSDYLGAAILPSSVPQVLARLERCVLDLDPWDDIDLPQLRVEDPLNGFRPARLRETRMDGEPCPGVTWEGSATAETVLPTRLQSNLRYYRRRLERHARVEFSRVNAAGIDEALSRLIEFHAIRWGHRGGGVLGSRAVQTFHREAARRLDASRLLALYTLRLSGRIAAVAYCLQHAPATYYYLGGFEPADADLSPGTLVIAHAIEDTVRRGARTFDFLRGQEPYKYLWGARDSRTVSRLLTRRVKWADTRTPMNREIHRR